MKSTLEKSVMPRHNPANAKKKKRQSAHPAHRKTTKERIRDIDRLLAKASDLGAEAREALLDKRDALEQQSSQNKRLNHFKKRQKFYKGLRFVEEQKVLRQMKSLRKRLATLLEVPQENLPAPDGREEAIESLKREMQQALDNLEYIRLYPSEEPYVALFPTSPATSEKAEAAETKRQRIRKLIKDQIRHQREAVVAGCSDDEDEQEEDFFETPDSTAASLDPTLLLHSNGDEERLRDVRPYRPPQGVHTTFDDDDDVDRAGDDD